MCIKKNCSSSFSKNTHTHAQKPPSFTIIIFKQVENTFVHETHFGVQSLIIIVRLFSVEMTKLFSAIQNKLIL